MTIHRVTSAEEWERLTGEPGSTLVIGKTKPPPKIVRFTSPELCQLIDAVDGIAASNDADRSTRSIALGKLMRALVSNRDADLEAPLPDVALKRVQQWRMTRTIETEPALLLSPEEQAQQRRRRKE